MQTVICPIDNKPCDSNCPDRYRDEPAGGCFLTTAIETGVSAVIISTKEAAPGAANTESGKVETVCKTDFRLHHNTKSGGFQDEESNRALI